MVSVPPKEPFFLLQAGLVVVHACLWGSLTWDFKPDNCAQCRRLSALHTATDELSSKDISPNRTLRQN